MSDKGYCEKCGAYQWLSYGLCNYNGVCRGKILPELNYKIVLSEFGKKTLDSQIYQQGVVVARKKHNGSVFVQWEGAIKPMWMPETYVDYGVKTKTTYETKDKTYTDKELQKMATEYGFTIPANITEEELSYAINGFYNGMLKILNK